MTRPGKTIKVIRSVVTQIRIEPSTGSLIVEGVDQGSAGQTLQTHTIAARQDELDEETWSAVDRIRRYAQEAIDEA